MSTADSAAAVLAESVRFPGALAFAQMGSFHRPIGLVAAIGDHATTFGWDAQHLSNCDLSAFMALADTGESFDRSLFVLDDLEMGIGRPDFAEALSRLRPAVSAAREKGGRVLMISRSPVSLYPTVLGSSVLLDTSLARVRRLEIETARQIAIDANCPAGSVERIVTFASGSRRLLDEFLSVELSGDSGNQKRLRALAAERAVALKTFQELGANILSWLEYWLLDCGHDQLLETDDRTLIMNSIRLAGLASSCASRGAIELIPLRNRDVWKSALVDALVGITQPPPDWAMLVEDLFRFERTLRAEMHRSFTSQYGEAGWRNHVLATLEPSIVELASRDQVRNFEAVDGVWSPLDWLSLSQILDLAQDQAREQGMFLRCSEGHWADLQRDVTPVRNRVAHMRLPRQGDVELLHRHLRRLELTSGMTFRMPIS